MPPQQAATGPTPMEGVERTNTVVVREQEQSIEVSPRRDPYVMEIDRGKNSYTCRGFGHMAHHCRNRGRGRVMEGRKVEYSGGKIKEIYNNVSNLKGGENLELLD